MKQENIKKINHGMQSQAGKGQQDSHLEELLASIRDGVQRVLADQDRRSESPSS